MPETNRHIIKRQVLEIQGVKKEDARLLQERMGRLFHKQILPLIDRYLTTISPNGSRLRLNKLELDLGKVAYDKLEEEVIQQVEIQLKKQLAGIKPLVETPITADTSQKPPATPWEIFQYFVRTGSLPWWTDMTGTDPVKESLDILIKEEPELLVAAMRNWVTKEFYLRRLIRQIPSALIWRLVVLQINLPQTMFARPVDEFLQLLPTLSTKIDRPAYRLREEAWLKLLQLSYGSSAASRQDAMVFWRDWLIQLATVNGIKYERWLHALAESIRPDSSPTQHVPSDLAVIVHQLLSEEKERSTSENVLAKKALSTSRTADWEKLRRLLKNKDLPVQLRTRLLAVFQDWRKAGGASSGRQLFKDLEQLLNSEKDMSTQVREQVDTTFLLEKLIKKWTATITSILEQISLPPTLRQDLETQQKRLQSGNWQFAEIPALLAVIVAIDKEAGDIPETLAKKTEKHWTSSVEKMDERKAFFDHSEKDFSTSEELFVSNCGLVILWPFLTRFFTHLGLLENKRFVDHAAAHRAAVLLQFLASGQQEFPEYVMGLNKIICGLAWDEVLDLGPPLTEAEMEECEALLQAVIANAAILKNMSVDGFRGTFLLREGMLKPRPDIWELHVEKANYDVVLEKFPWSWKVIKLPWLEKAIVVEWGK